MDDLSWHEPAKQNTKEVLQVDLMSSDEEDPHTNILHAKKFTWESEKLTEIKRKLDSHFRRNIASDKAQNSSKKYGEPSVSDRSRPDKMPSWAGKD